MNIINYNLCRKYITFDLDTNYLDKELGNYTKAYSLIKDFMLKNNFSHRQGSAYISNNEMSDTLLYSLIKKMYKELKFMNKGCRKIDGLNVSDNYDLKLAINKAINRKVKLINKNNNIER